MNRINYFVLILLLCCLSLHYAFYNGLCKSIIVTSTVIPTSSLTCSMMGGQLITLTAFNSSVSFVNCNITTTNFTVILNANNIAYEPLLPMLFYNLTQLSMKTAMDIASFNFIKMTSSILPQGGICDAGGVAYTFTNQNESITINNCNKTTYSSASPLLSINNFSNGTIGFNLIGATITNFYLFSDLRCDVNSFIFTASGINYTVCYPRDVILNAGSNVLITNGSGVNNKTISTLSNVTFTYMSLGIPLDVSSGGIGVSSLTSRGLLSASSDGTSIVSTTMTNGQLPIGNTGNTPTYSTLSATTDQTVINNGPGSIAIALSTNLHAPGLIKDTTGLYLSTSASVSAAGASQGTATLLTTSENIVTTVEASTGIRLMVPVEAGFFVIVVNRGANTLNVYPASGAAIDGAATNAAVTIPAGASATYVAASTTQWYTTMFPIGAGSNVNSVTYENGQVSVAVTATPSLYSNIATLTQINPGANNFVTMIPLGSGTLTVPANALAAGSKVNFRIGGFYSVAGTTSISFRLLMDSVVIYTSTASPNPGASTNSRLSSEGDWSIFTDGVSGTMLGTGYINVERESAVIVATATTAYNTTAAHLFGIEFAFSTTNVANIFTTASFILWITKV